MSIFRHSPPALALSFPFPTTMAEPGCAPPPPTAGGAPRHRSCDKAQIGLSNGRELLSIASPGSLRDYAAA
jgi:hypothetical protein